MRPRLEIGGLISETPISILLQTAHYVVINKPPLCYSQPVVAGSNAQTVQRLLKAQYPFLFKINRTPFCPPKLVHRLDYQTSGAMVLATSLVAARMFSRGLQQMGNKGYSLLKQVSILWKIFPYRSLIKYVAVLDNSFYNIRQNATTNITWFDDTQGIIEADIDSKPALTKFRLHPELSRKGQTLCAFELITGRKRQIRRHSAEVLGAPIVGDTRFAKQVPDSYSQNQIALHSLRLDIKAGSDCISVIAPINWGEDNVWKGYTTHGMVDESVCRKLNN
jgi:23S rRNA-/tRNA-specific pseudouridylate synthase